MLKIALVTALTLISLGCTRPSTTDSAAPAPRFEMDMTGAQYADLERTRPELFLSAKADAGKLKPVMDLGKRNLDLLKFINQHRDDAHKISLTSKENETANPIDEPRRYNVAIVLKQYGDLMNAMPTALKAVLQGGGALPENPPIAEDEYKVWGLKTDIVYQIGMRWLLMQPYLAEYAKNRKSDLRGYYGLSRDADLATEFANWAKLDRDRRAQLKAWMLGTCFNTEEQESGCAKSFEVASTQGASALQAYADHYLPLSKALWEGYFKMQWDRSDIVWSSAHPEVLRVPFVDPKDEGVMSYLRDNIEDEWKWNDWNLRLDFQNGSEDTMSHLRFEPGVTPHVEVPGTIVMDKNQPTTEYDSRWAIRHEFGHILGFPDCYIEFYDEAQGAMTSYQLDITNLMCSRRGAFQQTHFDELKRVYYR